MLDDNRDALDTLDDSRDALDDSRDALDDSRDALDAPPPLPNGADAAAAPSPPSFAVYIYFSERNQNKEAARSNEHALGKESRGRSTGPMALPQFASNDIEENSIELVDAPSHYHSSSSPRLLSDTSSTSHILEDAQLCNDDNSAESKTHSRYASMKVPVVHGKRYKDKHKTRDYNLL